MIRDIIEVRLECRYCNYSKCYKDINTGEVFCQDCGKEQFVTGKLPRILELVLDEDTEVASIWL